MGRRGSTAALNLAPVPRLLLVDGTDPTRIEAQRVGSAFRRGPSQGRSTWRPFLLGCAERHSLMYGRQRIGLFSSSDTIRPCGSPVKMVGTGRKSIEPG